MKPASIECGASIVPGVTNDMILRDPSQSAARAVIGDVFRIRNPYNFRSDIDGANMPQVSKGGLLDLLLTVQDWGLMPASNPLDLGFVTLRFDRKLNYPDRTA